MDNEGICIGPRVTKMASIQFRFKYKGNLAGAPYEINPWLNWWTSTLRSARHGVSRVSIEWENENNQESKQGVVSIPISEEGVYRPDDHIWVEAFVNSPTDEGMYVGARAGAASIRMKDVHDQAKKKGSFKSELDLVMAQMIIGGEPYVKGHLTLELMDVKKASKWHFNPATPYDLVENADRVNQLFNFAVVSSMFPYSDKASKMGMQYEPAVDRIESIHAPVWVSNVSVPGWVYWVDYSDYDPDEAFMENAAQITLARHGLETSWFLNTVDKQFSTMGEKYDENFTTAVAAVVDTCALLSVSLFYKSDESYVVQESEGWFNKSETAIRKKSIESFNDALVTNGDDCEGVGALIKRVMRPLKKGMPNRKGSDYWNAKGGWKDPVLQRMQRISYWYISGGPLGSVTAARVGGAKALNSPLIINSKNDRNSKLGGHMWEEDIPVPHFEDLCHRTNPSGQKIRIRSAEYPAWLSHLPHTVGEGTGAVYPLLRPVTEYYSGNLLKQKKAESAIKLRAAYILYTQSKYLRMGQIQRIQKMLENHPDARLSGFYRRTTTFYTDELLEEGFPVAEFMWAQMSPRGNESEQNGEHAFFSFGTDKSSGHAWKWGANMRDKIRHETATGKKLGLVTVPPCTNEEMEAIRSLVRQLPPLESPRLSPDRRQQLEKYAKPFIDEFQKIADRVTQGRREGRVHGRLNVIFRREEFFRGRVQREPEEITLRDGLLHDIKQIENIYKIHTVFEPVTDRVYNVRVEVYMNMPSNESINETMLNAQAIPRQRITTKQYGVSLCTDNKKLSNDNCEDSAKEIHYFTSEDARRSFYEGVHGLLLTNITLRNKPPGQLKAYTKGLALYTIFQKTGQDVVVTMCEDEIERSEDNPWERNLDPDSNVQVNFDDNDNVKIETDEYGSSNVYLGSAETMEDLDHIYEVHLGETIDAVKKLGYTSYRHVVWEGMRQIDSYHTLYIFRLERNAQAFTEGMSIEGRKISETASAEEKSAFDRGKALRELGLPEFRDFYPGISP